MKKLFACAIAWLFVAHFSYGQVAARVFYYQPTGEFGFAMKPLVSAELSYQDRFSKRETKRWRYGFSAIILNMKPRMEVFPVYGVLSDGNGTRVLPGEQSFQRYFLGQIAGGADFAFLHQRDFNVFAGADILVGGASVDYTAVYPGFKDESYQGGGILGGFRFRLGAEYSFGDYISAFFTANRSVFLITDPAAIPWAVDYGLGLRYSFD